MILTFKTLMILIGIIVYPFVFDQLFFVVLLLFVSLSLLYQLKLNNRLFPIYLVLYCLIVICNVEFIMFLPVVIIDSDFNKFYLYIVYIVPILLAYNLPIQYLAFVIIMSILSFLLERLYDKVNVLEKSNYEMIDNDRLLLSQLKSQNKQILIHQQESIDQAMLSERSRIAREIHDHLGHILSSSMIQLGAIQVLNQNEKLDKPLITLQASLKEGVDSIRSSIHHLYDEAFDFSFRLKILSDRQKQNIVWQIGQLELIPKDIQYDLYMIIVEAFNNVSKHSDATSIRCRIGIFQSFYQLIIHDDGHAIAISVQGIGLKSINDRVERWQGVCRYSIEKGFKIHITIPRRNLDESHNC